MYVNIIEEILQKSSDLNLSLNDQDFFKRVWSTDNSIYQNRLRAIEFEGLDYVLDAGCGFGQWSESLSRMNKNVEAIDFDLKRVQLSHQMFNQLGLKNLNVQHMSIEHLDFKDNSFDAIFSYSVILMVNPYKAIKEFYRVLKPGGKLYFCTNDIGWWFKLIEEPHNSTEDYSPAISSFKAIENTVNFLISGKIKPGEGVFIPTPVLKEFMEKQGFANIEVGGEGTLNKTNARIKSFFEAEYKGYTSVVEVLANK